MQDVHLLKSNLESRDYLKPLTFSQISRSTFRVFGFKNDRFDSVYITVPPHKLHVRMGLVFRNRAVHIDVLGYHGVKIFYDDKRIARELDALCRVCSVRG